LALRIGQFGTVMETGLSSSDKKGTTSTNEWKLLKSLLHGQCTHFRKLWWCVSVIVWIVIAIYWEPMDLGESDCL